MILRLMLIIQAIIMLAWGIALFIDPAFYSASWPWRLTPLTSRAVGAWLIGIGALAVHASVENNYARIRVGLISYLAFGILEIITLLRYSAGFT
jgi:hypothetical protein